MACFLVQPLFLAASPAIALPPQSQKFKPKTFDTRTSSEDLAQVVRTSSEDLAHRLHPASRVQSTSFLARTFGAHFDLARAHFPRPRLAWPQKWVRRRGRLCQRVPAT